MAHGHGLKTRETGLQQAAFVVAPAFMAVHVAEVDFHAGDLVGEPAHSAFHHGLDLVGQLVVRGNGGRGVAPGHSGPDRARSPGPAALSGLGRGHQHVSGQRVSQAVCEPSLISGHRHAPAPAVPGDLHGAEPPWCPEVPS